MLCFKTRRAVFACSGCRYFFPFPQGIIFLLCTRMRVIRIRVVAPIKAHDTVCSVRCCSSSFSSASLCVSFQKGEDASFEFSTSAGDGDSFYTLANYERTQFSAPLSFPDSVLQSFLHMCCFPGASFLTIGE